MVEAVVTGKEGGIDTVVVFVRDGDAGEGGVPECVRILESGVDDIHREPCFRLVSTGDFDDVSKAWRGRRVVDDGRPGKDQGPAVGDPDPRSKDEVEVGALGSSVNHDSSKFCVEEGL